MSEKQPKTPTAFYPNNTPEGIQDTFRNTSRVEEGAELLRDVWYWMVRFIMSINDRNLTGKDKLDASVKRRLKGKKPAKHNYPSRFDK